MLPEDSATSASLSFSFLLEGFLKLSSDRCIKIDFLWLNFKPIHKTSYIKVAWAERYPDLFLHESVLFEHCPALFESLCAPALKHHLIELQSCIQILRFVVGQNR